MKFFMKLNVVSILYALMLFVPIEIMINIYRISRLTGWDIGTVNTTVGVINIIGFIVCTILFIILIKNWLEGRKSNYWTILLWFPYFVLLIYIFASLFPINYGGDKPNPVTGLVTMGAMIVFPMYLVIINIIGTGISNIKMEKRQDNY